MTSTPTRLLVLVLLVASAPLAVLVPVTHGSTVISITTSNGATVCNGTNAGSLLNGSWSGSTCTISESVPILSGTTLNVGSGVTVTVDAVPGSGIGNYGTINNGGTMDITGYVDGIDNYGTINNDGTINPYGILGGDFGNTGTINNYCGATTPLAGGTVNSIPCFTVTFGQSGIATGGAWGVTVTWLFGTTRYSGTGGSIAAANLGGSVTYSYDTPVIYSGSAYGCSTGCSGSVSVSSATSVAAAYTQVVHPHPIPSGAAPMNLNFTTYGGTTLAGSRVGTVRGGLVEYNIPGFNGTLLAQDLASGDPTLIAQASSMLPLAISTCTTPRGDVRVSGFFAMWWGGGLNSTEVQLGDYQHFITNGAGWPAEPACGK